jgi:hypothetical protein
MREDFPAVVLAGKTEMASEAGDGNADVGDGTEGSPRSGSGLVWGVEEVAVGRGRAVVDVDLACRASSTGPDSDACDG